MTDQRQRIDKWLWFVRVVKTRSLAQELAEGGKVRINGRKIDSAHQPVKVGDVLTIAVHGGVRVLEVAGFSERRVSFPEAQKLYVDRAPRAVPAGEGDSQDDDPGRSIERPLPEASAPSVVRGEGRPSKRDRRRMDRVKDTGDS